MCVCGGGGGGCCQETPLKYADYFPKIDSEFKIVKKKVLLYT